MDSLMDNTLKIVLF